MALPPKPFDLDRSAQGTVDFKRLAEAFLAPPPPPIKSATDGFVGSSLFDALMKPPPLLDKSKLSPVQRAFIEVMMRPPPTPQQIAERKDTAPARLIEALKPTAPPGTQQVAARNGTPLLGLGSIASPRKPPVGEGRINFIDVPCIYGRSGRRDLRAHYPYLWVPGLS